MKSIFHRLRPFVSTSAILLATFGVYGVSASVANAIAGTTIMSDSFGTGSSVNDIPNWDEEGADSDSTTLAQAAASGNDSASSDGGRFAKIGEQEWMCREVSATGFNTLQLSYFWRGDSAAENSDHGIVEYKAGSGSCSDSGWTQLKSHDLSIDSSWTTQAAFALPGALDNTTFRLRYRDDSSASDENFRVDGVLVTGIANGTLQVKKTIVNNDGGTKTAANFSFKVNGGSAVAFEADAQNDLSLAPGTYTVTEVADSGYAASFSNCTSVVVASGGTATCTITNNDIAPTLTVTKIVTNDNGGTAIISNFPLLIGTTPILSGQTASLSAGTYTVSEVNQDGYTAYFAGDCAPAGVVTLAVGDTKTCVITNDDQPGTFIVRKVIAGSDRSPSEFSFQLDGGVSQNFESDGENAVVVSAGIHTVTEVPYSGFTTTYNNCDQVLIGNGGTATCTITNTYRRHRSTGTLVIQGVVVGAEAPIEDFSFQFGGNTDVFEVDGTNEYVRGGAVYTVQGVSAVGYTITYSEGCDADGVVTVRSGVTTICQITYTAAGTTPTPSVEPTPSTSPEPSVSPSPEPSTSPEPTPAPSESPAPTPSTTPEPSVTPTPSTTPEPSTSPAPSTSPEVSVTPEVSVEPSVSSTPEVSAEPTPARTPARTPVVSVEPSATPEESPSDLEANVSDAAGGNIFGNIWHWFSGLFH